MNLFAPLEGTAVLYSKGHYVEASLHTLKGGIYAQHRNGFIRLKDHDNTSAPGVYWRMIDTPHEYIFPMGNMELQKPVYEKPRNIKAV